MTSVLPGAMAVEAAVPQLVALSLTVHASGVAASLTKRAIVAVAPKPGAVDTRAARSLATMITFGESCLVLFVSTPDGAVVVNPLPPGIAAPVAPVIMLAPGVPGDPFSPLWPASPFCTLSECRARLLMSLVAIVLFLIFALVTLLFFRFFLPIASAA